MKKMNWNEKIRRAINERFRDDTVNESGLSNQLNRDREF